MILNEIAIVLFCLCVSSTVLVGLLSSALGSFLESWKHNSVSACHPLIACYGIQKAVEQHLLVHQRYFKINSF